MASKPTWHLRRLSVASVLCVLASGCTTGLGPRAVRTERPDYNHQIVRSNDAELLLNLVRLRYNDSMLFLGSGGVVAQYSYDASLNAGGQAGGGTGSATVGTGLACSTPNSERRIHRLAAPSRTARRRPGAWRIAATAARVHGQRRRRAETESYVLTGPQSLTQRDKVRLIGQAIGTPLSWEEIPPSRSAGP
jgi:hypothetical protein